MNVQKVSCSKFSLLTVVALALTSGSCPAQTRVLAELDNLAGRELGAFTALWATHFTGPQVRVSSPNPSGLFPDLASFQLEGKLPETKGKVVLVDFWASWCAPCRQSFKTLNDLHQRFGSEGLVVIAVNVDEDQKHMARFLTKNPAAFAVVRDTSQKLVTALDVKAMPTSFLVDRDGKLRHAHSGYHGDETPKQYEQEITGLLRSSASTP